jgi:3-oxoacyl-[acyl-carrier protein] reductase
MIHTAHNLLPEYIIVTGAGRGIGKEIALTLGAAGCVVLCISKSDSCIRTKDEIVGKGGKSVALSIDLSDYDLAHQQVIGWIESNKASSLGVVAAAAVLGPQGTLLKTALAGWENTLKTNLLGNLAVVRAALPAMTTNKYGRIIMFAGGGSAYAYPTFAAYACSKTAIVREVENIAEDLNSQGDIAITCIAPGAIETDMLAAVRAAGGVVRTPGKMEEVITCVKGLLGPQAKLLSGRFIHVRDAWQAVLDSGAGDLSQTFWKLRRVE